MSFRYGIVRTLNKILVTDLQVVFAFKLKTKIQKNTFPLKYSYTGIVVYKCDLISNNNAAPIKNI